MYQYFLLPLQSQSYGEIVMISPSFYHRLTEKS